MPGAEKIMGYSKRRKLFTALLVSFVLLYTVLPRSVTAGRRVVIGSYKYGDKVYHSEGWVRYEFPDNNILSVKTSSEVLISIEIERRVSSRNISLDINNSVPLKISASLGYYDDPDPQPDMKHRWKSPLIKNKLKNTWQTILQLDFNETVDKITVGICGGSKELAESEGEERVYIQTDDGWAPLPTEVNDGILTTDLYNVSGTVYISVFYSEPDPLPLYIMLGAVITGIIAVVAVMTKAEYKRFLLNRRMIINSRYRLSMEEVLENANRSKIIDIIIDNPGIHFNELLRRTGLSPGNLVWHLDILETYKIIVKKNVGQYIVYFPYYNENPISNLEIKLVKSRITLKILKFINEHPGTYANVISRELGLDHKTVKYHLDKLAEPGLIKFVKKGRKKLLYPNSEKINDLSFIDMGEEPL